MTARHVNIARMPGPGDLRTRYGVPVTGGDMDDPTPTARDAHRIPLSEVPPAPSEVCANSHLTGGACISGVPVPNPGDVCGQCRRYGR